MTAALKNKRKYFARFGLVAKGTIYSVTGLLVFLAAFEIGGKSTAETSKTDILNSLVNQPAGTVVVLLLGFGSLSYALWRYLQAFSDTENKGNNYKGIGKRISYFFSGLTYSALAFLAIRIALFKGKSQSGSSTRNLVEDLLSKPFGQWLIMIWALVLLGIGFYQIWYGLAKKFEKHVNGGNISYDVQPVLNRAGKIGYVARGIVWLILGFLLGKAALHRNPSEAGDTSTAFSFIKDSPAGIYLLAAVGIGLICYGVLNFVRARYEEFD